jgi:hypothetical protein
MHSHYMEKGVSNSAEADFEHCHTFVPPANPRPCPLPVHVGKALAICRGLDFMPMLISIALLRRIDNS